jgi:stage II sporulation protein AA (anti-sigma F factor antagonist)
MQVGLKHEDGPVTVCTLAGNLEYLTVSQFRSVVAQLPPAQNVVFEMSGTTFIDSAGIGALIGAVRRVREMGADAVVCGLRPSVYRVLNLVGLPRVVSITDDLAAARELLAAAAVA